MSVGAVGIGDKVVWVGGGVCVGVCVVGKSS